MCIQIPDTQLIENIQHEDFFTSGMQMPKYIEMHFWVSNI